MLSRKPARNLRGVFHRVCITLLRTFWNHPIYSRSAFEIVKSVRGHGPLVWSRKEGFQFSPEQDVLTLVCFVALTAQLLNNPGEKILMGTLAVIILPGRMLYKVVGRIVFVRRSQGNLATQSQIVTSAEKRPHNRFDLFCTIGEH